MFRLMHVWCHVKNKKSFEVKLTFSGILFLVIFLPLESFGSCNKIWNDMKNVFNFLALKMTLLKKRSSTTKVCKSYHLSIPIVFHNSYSTFVYNIGFFVHLQRQIPQRCVTITEYFFLHSHGEFVLASVTQPTL